MTHGTSYRAVIALAGLQVLACSNAPPPSCVLGESRACACTDGRSGAQECEPGGALGPCVCTGAPDAEVAELDASVPFDADPGLDAGADVGNDGGSDVGFDAPSDAGPGILVDFTAERGVRELDGYVSLWEDQSGHGFDAVTTSARGPLLGSALVNGAVRPILHFDGAAYLTAEPSLPPSGTIVIVVGAGAPSTYAFGWDTGGGISLMPSYGGSNVLVVREGSAVGDINGGFAITDVECDVASWGPEGVTFERHRSTGAVLRFSNTSIRSLSNTGGELRIASPAEGPGTWSPLAGDIAALRVYDRQLSREERDAVADEMFGPPVGPFDAGPPDAPLSPRDCRVAGCMGPMICCGTGMRAGLCYDPRCPSCCP